MGNLIFSTSATAQVTTDGTTNTTVNSDSNGNFTIEQGDRAGDNLFHSFGDFSVPTDGSAFFNNATDISNIFSRVTGGNISNIDGLIGANGSANLFLINPAGILFGNNARLDIGGSFFGTTADSILFEDGEFSATDLDNPPLLTINAPIGLNFRENPSEIVNRSFVQNEAGESIGLEVNTGENLSLVGGDVTFDAGKATAPGGRIEIGGLNDAGTLTIELDGSLTYPEDLARANVSFTNAADVDVRSEGEGSILINANNIAILEGSNLLAGILEGSQLPNSQAGDIILNAQENIRIAGSNTRSTISNQVGNLQTENFLVGITTQGSAGNIIFNSNTFEGDGNFDIRSVTSGAGDAGQININGAEAVSLVGNEGTSSGVLSAVGATATGNGGDVTITTSALSIFNSSLLLSTIGNGNTGNLRIEASDSIAVSGISQFQSTSFGNGNAGNIVIDAPNVNITFENPNTIVATSILSTTAFPGITPELATTLTEFGIPTISTGSSGDITVTGRNLTLNDGAGFFTTTAGQAPTDGLANAGNITINVSDNFTLSGNSQLESSTSGQGNAGDVNITAGEQVSFESSNIRTTVDLLPDALAENFTQVRQGGDINVTANSVLLTNGSQVLSNTFSSGEAGDINIFSNNIEVNGGADGLLTGLFAQVGENATGQGGNINLGSEQFLIQQLTLNNGAQIGANTFGEGDAGSLSVFSNNIKFDGGVDGILTGLFAQVGENATGNGGNIFLGSEQSPIGQLSLNNGGQISVSTFAQGDAGSLSIFSNDIKLDGQGLLTGLFASVGSSATGQGGDIFINTDLLTLTNGGRVAANVESMGRGNAGTLEISASDSIVINGTTSEGAPSAITSVVNRDENGEGIGNGGDITVSTGSLSLIDGGRVSATSLGQGDGGDLTINASESIFISGLGERFRSGISVDALVNDGDSGNANITTNQLTIENGGTIEASNIDSLGEFPSGTGEPGNINIKANSITLNNGGRIDAATQSESETGEGANINLQVNDTIRLENNSFISAQAFDTAKGGNLTVNTDFIIAFPNETPGNGNDIIASAVDGDGGNISISAESLLGIEERTAIAGNRTNDIDASSEFGLDGTISIFTPDINPIQGVTELPNNVVEPEQTVTQACANNRGTGAANSFVVKGRGGVPTLSNAPLSSETITVGGESETSTTNITTIATENGNITLARGAIKTADGQIILTPTPVTGSATRTANGSPNCG